MTNCSPTAGATEYIFNSEEENQQLHLVIDPDLALIGEEQSVQHEEQGLRYKQKTTEFTKISGRTQWSVLHHNSRPLHNKAVLTIRVLSQ